MWALLELLATIAIVLISITEFFIPLIFDKPLFGSFRKSKNEETKDKSAKHSNEKDNEADENE